MIFTETQGARIRKMCEKINKLINDALSATSRAYRWFLSMLFKLVMFMATVSFLVMIGMFMFGIVTMVLK